MHPEYAKLAEERLKAATNRIVSLESEVGQLNTRWADEKVKNGRMEQKVNKLNDRVAQVKSKHKNVTDAREHTHACLRRWIRPSGCMYAGRSMHVTLRECVALVQANELQGKMKQQEEEMKQQREADCKELVDLRQKQKAALALVKQLQDMVSKQKDDQDALVREKVWR